MNHRDRTDCTKRPRNLRRLFRRARHENRLTKHRPPLPPGKPFAKRDDIPNDDRGGCAYPGQFDRFTKTAERRHASALLGQRAMHHGGCRRVRRLSARDDLRHELRQVSHAHQHNQRIHSRPEFPPSRLLRGSTWILVPRDDSKGRGMSPVRYRNPGVAGHGDR